ncbi:nicotinate-nucleotide adenylyltransferase [Sandarakinorhabdus sp.]|uniref:nicotinate-nucleotide adenylyltransferase n=1 Tax=Sandarakinorhabdus sp. TaxID=1916663 RepID=UPI00286DA070|nr:nicotinate-nucleotide adenylyltransferase [Sandarakinorhabdus sp.]
MARIGLLGGSFNPAHAGHRHISLVAMEQLLLDEVWWLVSPLNPLKAATGMAPLEVRTARAQRLARHPRIKVSALEQSLGTRFAVDTARALKRRCPHHDFVWIGGDDILAELHRWRRWRQFLHQIPLAVVPRPGVSLLRAPALKWAGWSSAPPWRWTDAPLPAIIKLKSRLRPESATAIRAADPDWATTARPDDSTIEDKGTSV